MKKVSEQIKNEGRSLESRGIPKGSFFEVQFDDDSIRDENTTNWSDFCEEKTVVDRDRVRTLRISKHQVKKIKIKHGKQMIEMNVKKDEQVYQAIRSRVSFTSNGKRLQSTLGRIVGKVKNGEIIEEYILDGVSRDVQKLK